jgi:NitT/TauT family transport system permease protein
MAKAGPSFITLLVFLGFWHCVSWSEWVPLYLLPSPGQVLAVLSEQAQDFQVATLSTLRSTLIGFLMSALAGFSMALFLVRFELLRRALLPFAIFFQTVPVVAIAPLLVIWFGFGESTVRVSSFIVSFFPVLASSLVGLNQVDPLLRELFRAYRASRLKTLWSLQIPASLSTVFSGLQVAAGLAVIGAIVGEFVAGGGLGGLIDAARTQQRVDLVFAALILSSGLGILLVATVRLGARALLKFRPFFPSDLF